MHPPIDAHNDPIHSPSKRSNTPLHKRVRPVRRARPQKALRAATSSHFPQGSFDEGARGGDEPGGSPDLGHAGDDEIGVHELDGHAVGLEFGC